jgi:hypothetical protein
MGLVPPAKAFHLQVATSKSDRFPRTRNLPLAAVCEQQPPLHFDTRFFEALHFGIGDSLWLLDFAYG